jgi:hypothetical protein
MPDGVDDAVQSQKLQEHVAKGKEELRNEIFIRKRKSRVKLQHVSFRIRYFERNPER